METHLEPSSLPPLTRVLLENIALRCQANDGFWRLEVEFSDGLFQTAWLHQRVSKAQLGDFDQAAGAS